MAQDTNICGWSVSFVLVWACEESPLQRIIRFVFRYAYCPPHTVYVPTAFFFTRSVPNGSFMYNYIQLKSAPVFAILCSKESTLISYPVHMRPKKCDVSSMVASSFPPLLLGENEEFYCGGAPENDSVFLFFGNRLRLRWWPGMRFITLCGRRTGPSVHIRFRNSIGQLNACEIW